MNFERHFELVSRDKPDFGQIALIPWDIETFGFGVADYKFDYSQNLLSKSRRIAEKIEKWAKDNNVELVGTTAEATDYSKISFIQSLGFRYIDTTIFIHYLNIQTYSYPDSKLVLVPSTEKQLKDIIQISGEVFETGRYHSDKSFPKKLADKRYQDWVQRAFRKENHQELLAAQKDNQVCAFVITEVKDKEGHLHLNAVSRNWQGKGIGLESILSMLYYFKKSGVERVTTKISVSNIRAMNLHSRLGVQFDNPQILFHWHSPQAENLIKFK